MDIIYWILDGKRPIPTKDANAWAAMFECSWNRIVGRHEIGDGYVSTVFLGMDHSFGTGPPLLFETMIFGGEDDQYQARYSTWDEAEEGHAEAVAWLQAQTGAEAIDRTEETREAHFNPPTA